MTMHERDDQVGVAVVVGGPTGMNCQNYDERMSFVFAVCAEVTYSIPIPPFFSPFRGTAQPTMSMPMAPVTTMSMPITQAAPVTYSAPMPAPVTYTQPSISYTTQEVQQPRTYMEPVTKTIQVPKTVMEDHDVNYEVPKVEMETRTIQVRMWLPLPSP